MPLSFKLLKSHALRLPTRLLNRLLLLGALPLSACSTLDSIGTPANPVRWMEREVNACLPTAIIFKESLARYGVSAEVVTYKSHDPVKNKHQSHAIVVFNYPKGKDTWWTYDFEGSFQINGAGGSIGAQKGSKSLPAVANRFPVDVNNPVQVAQIAEISRFRSHRRILEARFLD